MQRSVILFGMLLSISATIAAQNKIEYFELKLPEQKIAGSLYNNISLLDARRDTSSFGIVQVGAFNAKAKVISKNNFGQQLQTVLAAMADSVAGTGKLLLQLRQFSFAEMTGAMSEKGYCFVRANLYAVTGNSYKLINAIDTVIAFSSMDVTKKLLRKGSETITGFIANSLTTVGADSAAYNYTDIVNIDSIEKRKIRLYNIDHYEEGVYTTYEGFKNQLPKYKDIIVKMGDTAIKNVRVKFEDETTEKLKPKDIYAVVYKGIPYIATSYGYYPLTKNGDDFFFTGQAKVAANAADIAAASFFFGIIGGLLASNDSSVFEMKIDHLNGGFIHLREIPNANPAPVNDSF
jgi:hypothetical protein